jgi:hypothetical protein
MDHNKVHIVCGTVRSGTSLMMQTLIKLGVPIKGNFFPDSEQRISDYIRKNNISELSLEIVLKRLGCSLEQALILDSLPDELSAFEELSYQFKRLLDLNPKGFYEMYPIVQGGLQQPGVFAGHFVKMILPGIVATPPDIIGKIIFCLRDPIHVSNSRAKLPAGMVFSRDNSTQRPKEMVLKDCIFAYYDFAKWIVNSPSVLDRMCLVEYDSFINNPIAEIEKLSEFLAIHKDITDAIENVDPNLRRAPKNIDVSIFDSHEMELAYNFYNAFASKSITDIELAYEEAFDFVDPLKREIIPFYDEETNVIMTADYKRRVNNDPHLKRSLINKFAQDARSGLNPRFVQGFKLLDEKYTVHLPADLGGDMSRNLVEYKKKKMTQEECYILNLYFKEQKMIVVDQEKIAHL